MGHGWLGARRPHAPTLPKRSLSADNEGIDESYVIHRCIHCGSHTLGGHEEIWHLRNGCPGFKQPRGNIERVALVPTEVERLADVELEGRG